MAKMTDQEWEAFKKLTGYNDPEGIAIKEQKENEKFMKDLERIQYFPADLSYALDIGTIADMHVDTENGVQILRMTVVPKEKVEFKTIRVAPKAATRATTKRKQTAPKTSYRGGPGPVTRAPIIDADKPMSIGDKLAGAAKDWMQKKDKPQFMKDAGF